MTYHDYLKGLKLTIRKGSYKTTYELFEPNKRLIIGRTTTDKELTKLDVIKLNKDLVDYHFINQK